MSASAGEFVQPHRNMTNYLRLLGALTLSLIAAIGVCSCESKDAVQTYTEKKILIRGNSSEPEGLDPQVVTGVTESNIIRALFEGLCVEDPNDASNSLPGAAASWTHDAEYKNWQFKLQPDAKWSDGKPVTAQDFVFSYHRILYPKFGAKYASMLYFIKGAEDYNKNHRELYLIKPETSGIGWEAVKEINFRGDEDVKIKDLQQTLYSDMSDAQKTKIHNNTGLNNLNKEKLSNILNDLALFSWQEKVSDATKKDILNIYIKNTGKDLWDIANVGVKARGKKLLSIQLGYPTEFLPDITKHYTWYPVPKHAIAKHCKLMSQDKNYLWTLPGALVSNGPFKLQYWKMNHKIIVERNTHYWDNANVKLNGIHFLPIANGYTESRMYYDNQLHITDKAASELIDYNKQNYPKNLRQEPYLGTNFLRINTTDAIFDDINLRKALAYSIDSKKIITHVLKGGQTPASGVVPPMGDYRTAHALEYNVEMAKQFFSKTKYAGKPGSLTIELLTTDQDSAKVQAEVLQDMWKTTLGIKVKIIQKDWKSYLKQLSGLNYQLATSGWIGDYADATTFLDIWKKGDGNNRTGWSSEVFEAKLLEAKKTSDPALRLRRLEEAEVMFLKDFPIIPLYWYTTTYLLHQDVIGWNPSIMKNQPYKFLDLQSSKKSTK